jgi:hypothetical protein
MRLQPSSPAPLPSQVYGWALLPLVQPCCGLACVPCCGLSQRNAVTRHPDFDSNLAAQDPPRATREKAPGASCASHVGTFATKSFGLFGLCASVVHHPPTLRTHFIRPPTRITRIAVD